MSRVILRTRSYYFCRSSPDGTNAGGLLREPLSDVASTCLELLRLKEASLLLGDHTGGSRLPPRCERMSSRNRCRLDDSKLRLEDDTLDSRLLLRRERKFSLERRGPAVPVLLDVLLGASRMGERFLGTVELLLKVRGSWSATLRRQSSGHRYTWGTCRHALLNDSNLYNISAAGVLSMRHKRA